MSTNPQQDRNVEARLQSLRRATEFGLQSCHGTLIVDLDLLKILLDRPSQPPQNVEANDAAKGVVEEIEGIQAVLSEAAFCLHSAGIWGTEGELRHAMLKLSHVSERLRLALSATSGPNAEVEHLKDVLHRDQTGLAHALAEITKTVDGYSWVTQGRGPYAWDDDQYRKEMGHMLDAVRKISSEALTASGNLAHRECCGRGRFALSATSSHGEKGMGELAKRVTQILERWDEVGRDNSLDDFGRYFQFTAVGAGAIAVLREHVPAIIAASSNAERLKAAEGLLRECDWYDTRARWNVWAQKRDAFFSPAPAQTPTRDDAGQG